MTPALPVQPGPDRSGPGCTTGASFKANQGRARMTRSDTLTREGAEDHDAQHIADPEGSTI